MSQPTTSPLGPATDSASELFRVYEGYSKTLRTWLVAYGIGGPVLFLSHEAVWGPIVDSGGARSVGLLFLLGVGLQVVLSSINKTTMWGCYYGEINAEFAKTRRYRVCSALSTQYWIDFVVDVLTILCFVVATFQVFRVLTT